MRIFGIAGYSGSGKTTLIEKLIYEFKDRDSRISIIKHAHHDFDIDKPGKDSYRHRKSGAHEVLISSSRRWALIHEIVKEPELQLRDLLKKISPCDLVLVEGFKQINFPKIEICRKITKLPLLFMNDLSIKAIASDFQLDTILPVFHITDYASIADFIEKEAVEVSALANDFFS